MPTKKDAKRPPWAVHIDRLGLIWARILAHVLPPPDEAFLARLARRHRPAPTPSLFNPADHGIEDHLERGRQAIQQGALGEALHHFGQRISEAPDENWAWHGRGDALQLMGQPQSALEAYNKAIQLSPKTGIHHGGKANALSSLTRQEEAEEAWADALQLDPSLTWMRKDRL